MPDTAIDIIQEKATGMMAQVNAFRVTNQEELATVSDMIANVKKLMKWITAEKEKFTAPAKAIIATAKEKYDPYIEQCRQAEMTLKTRASQFILAERVREDAEKAKLLKRVEAGRLKPETAMTKIAAVEEAPKATKTETSALTMTMRPDVKIVDQALIPDQYYKPRELDMLKLRRDVVSGVAVPGAERIEVPVMASR